MNAPESATLGFGEFSSRVRAHVDTGARFAGLLASDSHSKTVLMALLSLHGSLVRETLTLPTGALEVPTLVDHVPAALWYEREIADLFGMSFQGSHGREPLVLSVTHGSTRPRPGSMRPIPPVTIDDGPPRTRLDGEGVFTISYGPVRSGVFESVEYLVETPGEDIPSLNLRVSYKHRGIEKSFEGRSFEEGVLLAERYEGVASVAHALAYCGALESIADVSVSAQASFVRVVHAELERIANHLDSIVRHVEAAGQAVAYSRFTLHKERVQRLRGRICGSRFGRGVVVPGGVAAAPAMGATQFLLNLDSIQGELRSDFKLLMSTPSFLDRLRGTGVLPYDLVREHGALGPVARGSGIQEDVRFSRPYAAYGRLGHSLIDDTAEGDALARQKVREQEIDVAFGLIRRAIEELNEFGEPDGGRWSGFPATVTGESVGWSESPQGEILTWVRVDDGVLTRVKPRSASFHNFALFPSAFPKDILTDFAFIEASFGVSIAGVVG